MSHWVPIPTGERRLDHKAITVQELDWFSPRRTLDERSPACL